MFRSRAEKRAELRATPLEAERLATIARMFPYFARLSEADQKELVGHVQVFLAEKAFEGCGGLELTDEIKLTIAAQACLLLLHRETDYYPNLDVILVYPHTYVAGHTAREGGVVVDRDDVRLGESHQRGVVVLSWDAVKGGAADPSDGHNVVFHEFAHQLDQEDGVADGAPILPSRSSYAPWAKILGAEFEALKEDAETDRHTVIDKYGAKNPAEFFAVVTEAFFEKPRALATRHPELYDELALLYAQDPLARLGEPRPEPQPRVHAKDDQPPKEEAAGIIHCDMSKDPRAPKLVRVSAELRQAALALGCKTVGYLGTLHRSEDPDYDWGFVSEVLSCPDAHVALALSTVGEHGDDVAFWTLLENGTAIETETSARGPLWFRLRSLVGHHPREHFHIVYTRGTPREVYELHKERVEKIAAREKTSPLAGAGDPFRTYAAVRRRSADMLVIGRRQLSKLGDLTFRVGFVVAAAMLFGLVFYLSPPGEAAKHLLAVIALVLLASGILAALVTPPMARVIQWRQFRSAPVSPDKLFEHPARVDDASATRLVAALERTIEEEKQEDARTRR